MNTVPVQAEIMVYGLGPSSPQERLVMYLKDKMKKAC